jgi:glycosyltransferase involved in cell wall biosynthesis
MLPPAAHLLPLTDRFASALSPRVIGRLVAIRRQCAARIVHAHGYKAGVAAAVALAVAARRVPLVVTIHNLWPAAASGAARAALRFVARRAALIAVSEAVAESIRRVLPHAAVTVIGNGIEIDEFQDGDGPAVRRELGIPPDATLIGYFGRLTREKGADLALAAISILASRRPEARLLVAGDGPERAALEGTAGPEVCFLGERSDVPTLLAACDAVLIPSRAEGQSLVALEAMAAGRPIVAADVGGLGAMVRAIGGPVTPTEDPAAMARAIERLLADDDLRAGLIARGRAYVAEHASADCTAAAVAAVYDRLLGRKRC